jgi:tryptophanase
MMHTPASQSFYRFQKAVEDVLKKNAHQGRAAENILAKAYIRKKGDLIPMNCHFTTALAHITQYGVENIPFIPWRRRLT